MPTLAEATISDTVAESMRILGPIGAFIVIVCVALIVLYMKIIQPELLAQRTAAKEAIAKHESIAQANATSTSNLKDLSQNLIEAQNNNSKHHEYLAAQREFFGKLVDKNTK